MSRHRNHRFANLAAGLVLALASVAPMTARSEVHPITVGVAASGSIPGISDAELAGFLATTMNNGADGPWRFEPTAPGAPPPPNRIEWAIKTNASAEGTVRSYGFSRATMERLIGVHQFLSIEVKLYLDGQYQTAAHSEVTATQRAHDPDLAADVIRSTRQLMAYSTMDTTKPAVR